MVVSPPGVRAGHRTARARRGLVAGIGVSALGLAGLLGAAPASAVNAPQDATVSATPAAFTPQVMNGAVIAITQVGSKIIAAGTFTTVRQTPTSANIARNRMFAFDAVTGEIDPSFNPNFGGAVNSLDTDGTNIYAGGPFGSVGGNTTIKRVVKLDQSGNVVSTFKALPNKVVNEVVVRGNRLFVGGAFTIIKSGSKNVRVALAALDATTGAVLPSVNVPFAGTFNGGATTVKRFDVTTDGNKLVAVGNFTTVGGQPHEQIAVLDTPAGGTASVASWNTNRYDRAHNPSCASVFDTFMRDVDFAPDGSYFAVTSTGAFGGGASVGTLCDTTTRWETNSSGNDPTWVDYTGGDTTYGVAVTGSAIYVGGHMRWENNPFQGDQAGPGAVPREGIAALDPVNGLPLTWNPGRIRGVGAQALYATSTGLWVGSDTKKIAGQLHQRIAFMPLAGGRSVPVVQAATLPNDVFLAKRSVGATSGVLYRVNAGSGALQSVDTGPDWTSATGFVSGGIDSNWGTTVPLDATVPPSTPPDVFAAEHWGVQSWDFPVPAGKQVQVRLYFANQYSGTSQVGQRVFNVAIDGTAVLNDFDIVATTGDRRGTMKAFTITSDGNVDIDFTKVVENPLVNGIEIVDPSVSGGGTTASPLVRRPVDGSGSPTGAASTANAAIDWSTVRGAFLVNSTLYYGLGDGSLYARSFNAATGAVGTQRAVNLYDDPDTGQRIPFAIANLTGMFYDTELHRLYYSVFNDSRLYYRYFTPDSEVVGAQTFQANDGGVDFSTVSGMTLASGRILYGSSADGALRSVTFAGGAVTGTPTVVSNDGSWVSRAMFVANG